MSMKSSNSTIGNRTHNLPVCSRVPQPTAPPRTPFLPYVIVYISRKKSPKYPTHTNTTLDVIECTLLCYKLMTFSVALLMMTNLRISIYPYIHTLSPCTLQGIQKYKHMYVYSCVTVVLRTQKFCRGY
jgi:hypothetical protein